MSKVRTRFAPSPTGSLHIGSLRTILFAYAIAKVNKGDFLLRVEDTDQARKVEGSIESMVKIVNWLGLKFDEGPYTGGKFGPYIQSERLDIYKKYIDKLVNKGKAYKCFCTATRLKEMRAEQQALKLPPRYDRRCLHLSADEIQSKIEAGEPYVVRQKMPAEGIVTVVDELRGEIKFPAKDLDDQVLMKTDGFPTYQLAVVIDDHLMEISHVVRGEEWIPSFPKNWLLYELFGFEKPKFVHMPLSLNKNGGKLSKRHGDVAVEDFQAKGYLKEALINFSALQGWNPYDKESEVKNKNQENQEIFSLEEFLGKFKVEDMGTSPGVFDIDKLDYLNGYYIRQKPLAELLDLCRPYLEPNLKLNNDKTKSKDEFLLKMLKTVQERMKILSDVQDLSKFYFDDINIDTKLLAWKKMSSEQAKENLKKLLEFIKNIKKENWSEKNLENLIIDFIKDNDLKVGEYLWPMRVALTGQKASPGPFEVAYVLNKEETIKRIEKATKN